MKRILRFLRRILGLQPKPQPAPPDLGETAFDKSGYEARNKALLDHLDTMNLPMTGKKVIDLGCGVGKFAPYFQKHGCNLLFVDGRQDNIDVLKKRIPEAQTAVADLEKIDLKSFGKFDVVFSYGIVYHLDDPLLFIKRCAEITGELLLLESCVTDSEDPVNWFVGEPADLHSQSIHGLGTRPSRSYLAWCLKLSGFKYIYLPATPPEHWDYKHKMLNDYQHIRYNNLIRDIIMASHEPLDLPTLKPFIFK